MLDTLLEKVLAVMFKGFDGVFGGGFQGGVNAEDDANDDGEEESEDEDFPAEVWLKWSDGGEHEGDEVAKEETDDAAGEGKNEGFEEELHKDVAGAGTDGFADTDFVGAFGDGDEHDIHDADAADDERDSSDEGKDAGNDGKERVSRMSDFVAIGNGEVLVAGFIIFQTGVDLGAGGFKSVGGGGFDVDLLDLGRANDFVHGFDVHDEGVVEVDVVEIDGFV